MEDDTKICPFCAETIKKAAIVCRYCRRDLPPMETGTQVGSEYSQQQDEINSRKLKESTPQIISNKKEGDKNKSQRMGILIAVIAVIMAFTLIVILFNAFTKSSTIRGKVLVNGILAPDNSLSLYNYDTTRMLNSNTSSEGEYSFIRLGAGNYGVSTSFYIDPNYSCSTWNSTYEVSSFFLDADGIKTVIVQPKSSFYLDRNETVDIIFEIMCDK